LAETPNFTSTGKHGMKPAIDSLKTHRKNGTNGKTDFFYLSQQLVHGINESVKKLRDIELAIIGRTG
ncbi:hypothetical protein ACWBUO_005401, partial [Escherichia coli]